LNIKPLGFESLITVSYYHQKNFKSRSTAVCEIFKIRNPTWAEINSSASNG